MKILLDTNFVLTCVKKKIDFESYVNKEIDEAVMWIVPQEVLNELRNLSESVNLKGIDKKSAELGLDVLKTLDNCFTERLSKRDIKNVDMEIVNYLLKHDDVILATMDKGLKKRLPGRKILSVRGSNQLGFV